MLNDGNPIALYARDHGIEALRGSSRHASVEGGTLRGYREVAREGGHALMLNELMGELFDYDGTTTRYVGRSRDTRARSVDAWHAWLDGQRARQCDDGSHATNGG